MHKRNSTKQSEQIKTTNLQKTSNLIAKANVKESSLAFSKLFLLVTFALIAGASNSYHQYIMFENDRHFSHLSSLEREMTFRTEMGLYFSYYKSIVESSSFINGLNELLKNNLTEYPSTINTLQKFNLYPEVILGAAYRIFMTISHFFGLTVIECWLVDRGDNLDPVSSCEGLGDIHYFYVTGVFVLNSLVGFTLFFYGYILSDNNIFGGILVVLSFFFNHGEATRVQWSPPLRESFGYPFCLSGMFFLTLILKNNSSSKILHFLLILSNASFIITWQFAQFALLTQACCVYVLYLINAITGNCLKTIIQGNIIAVILGFVLLFGNKLLLTSFLTSFLFICWVVTFLLERFICNGWKEKIINVFAVCLGTICLKSIIANILQVDDDAHIWNLLKSKFTGYKDFHTLLYTCAVEFDFLTTEAVFNITKTLLLPAAIFCILAVFYATASMLWNRKTHQTIDADVLYNVLQIVAFTIMAALFMRLKLFLTPHLCILTSLLISKKYFPFLTGHVNRLSCLGLLIILMSKCGIDNLKQQRNILGEYNNPDLENLLIWVNKSTHQESVFAGPMPTMANLMLSTRRPIVNHPFYEDSQMRERNLQVYTLYSRKQASDVKTILTNMGVEYAIIAKPWCYGYSKPGCRMTDLWDIQDPENHLEESLCHKLMTNPKPFTQVFQNSEYVVLKVQKKK